MSNYLLELIFNSAPHVFSARVNEILLSDILKIHLGSSIQFQLTPGTGWIDLKWSVVDNSAALMLCT